MKRITAVMTIAVVALLAAQGCVSTAAKQAIGGVRGAKGLNAPIQSSVDGAESLGAYEAFELGKITDDFGKTPSGVLSFLPAEFAEALAEKKLPNHSGGKTLWISGKILHYEDASMVGTLIGGVEEVVARITFVDKATGKVLGVANCVGRSTTFPNRGPEKKAEGLARGIVSWIDERYPKEGRVEE